MNYHDAIEAMYESYGAARARQASELWNVLRYLAAGVVIVLVVSVMVF